MSDETQPNSPPDPGRAGQAGPDAGAAAGSGEAAQARPAGAPRRADAVRSRQALARQYAARRLGWIGEHARDDNVLAFMGVALAAALAFLVAYVLYREWNREEPRPPVPLALLFKGLAEEQPPGFVRVTYDFAYDERRPTDREACPQIGDWAGFSMDGRNLRFEVVRQGFIVCGGAMLRPFFEPGEISVECDVALVTGTQVNIVLASIYDNCDGDGYRLSLTASQRGGWPATAQLTRHQDGAIRGSSQLATLDDLRARRDPPLFYRAKMELSGGKVRAWFGPDKAGLREVGTLDAPDDLGAGKVVLTGLLSHTAYDNVTVSGRPHAEFVSKRTELYHLFDAPRGGQQPAAPAGARAETAPPGDR